MKGKYRVFMGAMLSLVPVPWNSVVAHKLPLAIAVFEVAICCPKPLSHLTLGFQGEISQIIFLETVVFF
jgi:hypothetical protein